MGRGGEVNADGLAPDGAGRTEATHDASGKPIEAFAPISHSGSIPNNSEGPFHGRARHHSPSSLMIYSMEPGDLRANHLSATRKVSHIQHSGHGPVVSSSPADILACCSHSYHFRTCPSRRSTAADARYTEASHRAGPPSEPLYLAATLRMTGPDALQRR